MDGQRSYVEAVCRTHTGLQLYIGVQEMSLVSDHGKTAALQMSAK